MDGPCRIRKPLRRLGKRGENDWEEISWEEALDLVAGHPEGLALLELSILLFCIVRHIVDASIVHQQKVAGDIDPVGGNGQVFIGKCFCVGCDNADLLAGL